MTYVQSLTKGDQFTYRGKLVTVASVKRESGYHSKIVVTLTDGRKLTFWAGDTVLCTL